MNVLAIDQGTSSTKALVIDPVGRVLGEGRAPVSPRASADGTVLQDPLELERSVLVAGRAALAAAGGAVSAIGLGNQGETVLRWDRDSGEPLGPAISWQDRRAWAPSGHGRSIPTEVRSCFAWPPRAGGGRDNHPLVVSLVSVDECAGR